MFLVDRYEILSKVGAGGMSDVYKAKDHILGRVVAIKVLKAEFSEDMNFVTKFRTEAQSAAGLEHPNIVNVYDVGSESGMHFIVMEHIEGITLKTYIEKKGQLSFKEATSIAIQVGRGIEAAHNKNITHRDIKPQNIIISTEGKVKVTDFGIAKAISSNTLSSDAMGSVHYVSPEQARNGFIDGRSDIYSLGIVMYEMVTGRVPFDGDTTVAVAIQHLQEEMVEPSAYAPEIPVSYEKIVLKMTQKSPERRYQTIGELLIDLRKALVTPDEDFVVIAPLPVSTTRVINGEELEMIQSSTSDVDLKKETGFVSVDDEEEYDEYDEEEDEEELLDPKMEKIMNVAGVAIFAAIILVIIFLVGSMLGLFNFGGGSAEESVSTEQTEVTEEIETTEAGLEMISIVGMSYEKAEEALEDIGIDIAIKGYRETGDKQDTVLEQSIKKDSIVKEGTVVEVVLAGVNPNEMIDIVSFVGYSEGDAANSLTAMGFKVEKQYKTSNDVEKGKVISQTPNSGKAAKKTKIVLVISEGKGKAIVPTDLVGQNVSTVTQILEANKFKVNTVRKNDSAAKDTVIAMDAAGGAQLEVGSTITLTVSDGPAKPTTYKFSAPYSNASATSYAYVLTDANGATLTSGNGTGNSVTISKTGITTASGTLKITWYAETTTSTQVPGDGNGDGVVDEGEMKTETTTSTVEVEVKNESVTFTAE